MESEADKIWGQFCAGFDKAVFDCADNGTASKMTIGIGNAHVTIEVYRDKGDMQRLTNVVTQALKPQNVRT